MALETDCLLRTRNTVQLGLMRQRVETCAQCEGNHLGRGRASTRQPLPGFFSRPSGQSLGIGSD